MREAIRLGYALCAAVWWLGCQSLQTQKQQFVEVDKKIEAYDFASAAVALEASKDQYYEKKDRVLFYLDAGMLYHYADNFRKSNELLTQAEESIDELYTTSISKAAASLLLNDNIMDYSGEAYEDVYLNVFKALNYLRQNNFDEAFVEVRRINNKLSTLEDRYKKLANEYNKSKDGGGKFIVEKNRFNNSALGRYLSALLYRTEGKEDDARIDLEKIDEAWRSQSQLYNFPKPSFDGCLKHSQKAKVNFLSFVGMSPQLFAHTLTIHTFKNAVAIYASDGKNEHRIDVIPWADMTDGYHFKFSLPYMQKFGTKVARVSVSVDQNPVSELQDIESLENAAQDTYRLKEKIIYIKTIIRAVAKGILNEKANVELDKQTGGGLLGSLTRLVTSAAVDVTENADLRLARYFPAKALIGEIEVEPGNHHVAISYFGADGRLLFADDREIVASKSNLNLIRSVYLQ
jgi:hypothetical protein